MEWSRTERVVAGDGQECTAWVMLPASLPAPGVLVLQEIFGVNEYVAEVCGRLAAAGFVAVAPDVYWRTEPEIRLYEHDEAAVKRALELGRKLDVNQSVEDLRAALDAMRRLPETTDRAGVVGFCLGGTLAYLLAARADPDVSVSYYGSGVPGTIDELERVTCPLLFHFGADDPVISQERVARVAAAAETRADVAVRVAPNAGHAFDNPRSGDAHDPAAAADAWAETMDVLHRALHGGTGARDRSSLAAAESAGREGREADGIDDALDRHAYTIGLTHLLLAFVRQSVIASGAGDGPRAAMAEIVVDLVPARELVWRADPGDAFAVSLAGVAARDALERALATGAGVVDEERWPAFTDVRDLAERLLRVDRTGGRDRDDVAAAVLERRARLGALTSEA